MRSVVRRRSQPSTLADLVANGLAVARPTAAGIPPRVRESAAILGLAGLMVVVAFFAAPGPPYGAWFASVRQVVDAPSAATQRAGAASGAPPRGGADQAGPPDRTSGQGLTAAPGVTGGAAGPGQASVLRPSGSAHPRRPRPAARQRLDAPRERAPRPIAPASSALAAGSPVPAAPTPAPVSSPPAASAGPGRPGQRRSLMGLDRTAGSLLS